MVFITAHDDPAVRAEAERRGCAGFFQKTDPGAWIVAAIRRAVDLRSSGSAVPAGPARPPESVQSLSSPLP